VITTRRPTYTRKQVEVLLDVTERTLIRWAKRGKPPRPYRDPNDPLQRVLYDREEVDRLARQRRRRRSGSHKIALESQPATIDLASFEPTVPGPLAAAVLKLLRNGVPLEEICERTEVAFEHVVRIERLRRQFEAERTSPPPPRESQPRIVIDEDDPVARAWAEQVDERGRRSPDEEIRDPPSERGDSGPKSKRRA